MSTTFAVTLDSLFAGRTSIIARDLKLNLKRAMEAGTLAPEEALLTLSAVASALNLPQLSEYARGSLEGLGLSGEKIQESADSAAIMGMLNTYYRFKHMTEHADDYKAAGLRMTVFANPLLGKTMFEMLAFAVSVLNGCEGCIRSHERALRQMDVPVEKIHELVRIAAIGKGIQSLDVDK
jgi:alkyl hydroperoxide reductase subunit D